MFLIQLLTSRSPLHTKANIFQLSPFLLFFCKCFPHFVLVQEFKIVLNINRTFTPLYCYCNFTVIMGVIRCFPSFASYREIWVFSWKHLYMLCKDSLRKFSSKIKHTHGYYQNQYALKDRFLSHMIIINVIFCPFQCI